MGTHILSLHIADFQVAVARAAAPRLCGRPVVVVTSLRPMGRVLALSPEARPAGVREGTRYPVARQFCPDAAFLTPDQEQESRAEYAILTAALQISPCLERYGAGRIFVDISGTRRLLGPPLDVASRLQKNLAGTYRLPGAVGLSCRKIWSRLAAQAVTPVGIMEVLPCRETDFLSLIPPEWVAGVGPKTVELLRDLNLTNLAQLWQFEPAEILRVFGRAGQNLLNAVREIERETDISPVENIAALLPFTENAIEADMPLTEESTKPAALRGMLTQSISHCGEKLRKQKQTCSRLKVTVFYCDGKNQTVSQALPECSAIDSLLFSAAEAAFRKAHARRVRICRILLRCEGLNKAGGQASLFSDTAQIRELRRLTAMDAIRERYGAKAILRGTEYATSVG